MIKKSTRRATYTDPENGEAAVLCSVLRETGKAWHISDDVAEVWIPKSQCRIVPSFVRPHYVLALMPLWLAEKTGLVAGHTAPSNDAITPSQSRRIFCRCGCRVATGELRRMDVGKGGWQIRVQCVGCGWLSSDSIKRTKPIAQYPVISGPGGVKARRDDAKRKLRA